MAMSIAEFVSDEGRLKGYGEWLKNPMTQELLDMAREYRAPAPLKNITGESALYQYGLTEGANLIITLLTRMHELAKQKEVAALLAQDPTYGAEKIMKEKYA